ncbi:hypothetical protein NDU88_007898 [Pleurodeles waltl]|uniref:Uncharacterized protein n=1 Tax=Pleurodeles waltl TaxID=8319 RepID=A0AAV7U535_PLEWA|nr:hypothetical protein NDU88_007898 [Pleurodeles waltl]
MLSSLDLLPCLIARSAVAGREERRRVRGTAAGRLIGGRRRGGGLAQVEQQSVIPAGHSLFVIRLDGSMTGSCGLWSSTANRGRMRMESGERNFKETGPAVGGSKANKM